MSETYDGPMVCYAEPQEPQVTAPVDADGLICPEIFQLRHDKMDLGPLEAAATSLRSMATRAVNDTDAIATSWTGLQGCYSSPEAPAVYALMVPAQTAAGQVSERLNRAAGAIDDYVAELTGFKGRLQTVVEDCEAFRKEALAGVLMDITSTTQAGVGDYVDWINPWGHVKKVTVSWKEDGGKGGMVDRNEQHRKDYAAKLSEMTEIAARCANAIRGVTGLSPEAAEALGVTVASGVSPDDLLAVWGPAATEKQNCMEQVGSGATDFGKGLLQGAGMLVLGYDPETGDFFSGKAYGQAWGSLGNLVGSLGVMALYGAAVIVTGGAIADVSFGDTVDSWLYDRAVVVRDAGASLIGYDPYAPDGDGWHNWKDEPWRVGTSTVANIGTFFIPGAGEVGGAAKAGSVAAKVSRFAGVGVRTAADLALPGGSWAVRAGSLVTRGGAALAHGEGWAGALDALRAGTGAGRPGALAVTAGTSNVVSDLDGLHPPVHMSPEVPSVSDSLRPVSTPHIETPGADLSRIGADGVPSVRPDVAGGVPSEAGASPAGAHPSGTEPATTPTSGAGGQPAHAETSPAGAGSQPARPATAGAPSEDLAGAGAAKGAVPDTVPDDAQSWLHQDAPHEPSAAERAEGAQVSEPVREPVLATVGGDQPGHVPTAGGPAGPSGSALDAAGRADAAPRASVVTEPRPALDTPAARPAVPDHGPSTSPSTGPGGDGHTVPPRTGDPGAPVGGHLPEGPAGDVPPHAGSPDGSVHDAPGGPHDVAGDGPGGAEPPAGPDRVEGGADGPGRVAIDDTGSPHVINTSDALVLAHDQAFSEVIDQVAADHGLTRAQLEDLVTTPVDQLTRDQVHTLVEIRDAMPPVTPDTVLQKIVPPDTAARVLAGDSATLRETGGFVARAADTARMPTSELYSRLGLDYPRSPFSPDGEMFAVRYRGGDPVVSGGDVPAVVRDTNGVLDAMARMPDDILDLPAGPERSAAMQQWIGDNAPDLVTEAERALDPDNAFRGNGFGGSGPDWAPEAAYPSRVEVPQGAEMWRITPDGSQQLAAVFRDGKWHPIVEQPLGGPDWTPPRGSGDGPGPIDPGGRPGGGDAGPVRTGDAGSPATPVGHLPEHPAVPDHPTGPGTPEHPVADSTHGDGTGAGSGGPHPGDAEPAPAGHPAHDGSDPGSALPERMGTDGRMGDTVPSDGIGMDPNDVPHTTMRGYEIHPPDVHQLEALNRLADDPASGVVRHTDGENVWFSMDAPVDVHFDMDGYFDNPDGYFKKNGIDPDSEYVDGRSYRDEYVRQLDLQQRGMNDLSVSEWQYNAENPRMPVPGHGTSRADAGGVPGDGTALLHGPDQWAGGRPNTYDGLGHSGINSSIGSKWRHGGAFEELSDGMAQALDLHQVPEDLLPFVRMNVRLVP